MLHNSSMVSHNHMAYLHRVSLNPMAIPGRLNQGTCLIKVLYLPNHTARMHHPNSLTSIHLVLRCSKHMLRMVLRQLLTDIVNNHLHPAPLIHSKERSQVTLSLVHSRYKAMHKWVLLGVTGLTQLRNKVTLSSQLLTMQLITKGLKILLTVVVLQQQPIVHHQVGSQDTLNQHQLNKVMTSLSHNQVDMEVCQQLLQQLMGKLCRLSLVILSMTRPKCMERLVENFYAVLH